MSEHKNGIAVQPASPSSAAAAVNRDGARLCHVVKRDNFDGYGFNLHAEKGKTGQYIGKVDDDSPAESAGLKQNDRILEVNGVDIGTETHKQVVQRIKAIANEVRLLVIDPDHIANAGKIAAAAAIAASVVSSSSISSSSSSERSDKLSGVGETTTTTTTTTTAAATSATTKTTLLTTTSTVGVVSNTNNNNNNNINTTMDTMDGNSKSHDVSRSSTADASAEIIAAEITTTTATSKNHNGKENNSKSAAAATTATESSKNSVEMRINQTATTAGAVAGTPTMVATAPTNAAATSTTKTMENGAAAVDATAKTQKLNLRMTAAELRAKLAAKKKYDPKNDVVDLKKKYDIVQKL